MDDEIKVTKKNHSKKTTKKKKNTTQKVEKKLAEVSVSPDKLSVAEEKDNSSHDDYTTVPPVENPTDSVEEKSYSTTKGEKPSIFLLLIILFLIFLMGIIIGYCIYTKPKRNGSFIFVKEDYSYNIEEDYLRVSSEDELSKIFSTFSTKSLDFSNHDYVILNIAYNSCSEENLTPVGYTLEDNVMHIEIEYEAKCGLCAFSNLYYLLEIDKNISFQEVVFDSKALNNPHCNPAVAYKPVIYFYPEVETKLHVTLGYPEKLITSYPRYQSGWDVVAYPDGTLKDSQNREYYSLFWEGNQHYSVMQKDGFVVKGDDTLIFLEEKLKILGLSDIEANEFIIYWLPKLENNPYNYIRFETTEEINQYMPLTVTPLPNSMIRVQMDYKPLSEKIDVAEQNLVTPDRSGFTVVEWGGSIIS